MSWSISSGIPSKKIENLKFPFWVSQRHYWTISFSCNKRKCFMSLFNCLCLGSFGWNNEKFGVLNVLNLNNLNKRTTNKTSPSRSITVAVFPHLNQQIWWEGHWHDRVIPPFKIQEEVSGMQTAVKCDWDHTFAGLTSVGKCKVIYSSCMGSLCHVKF